MTNIECLDMIIARAIRGTKSYEGVLLRMTLHKALDQAWQQETISSPDLMEIRKRIEEESRGQEQAKAMLEIMLEDLGFHEKGVLKEFCDTRRELN